MDRHLNRPTRFHRDKRNGKLLGVCAGIADYSGLDVTLVRVLVAIAALIGSFAVIPLYLIVGWVADDKPDGSVAPPLESGAAGLRPQLRDIDRRLAELEARAASGSLARKIDRLR